MRDTYFLKSIAVTVMSLALAGIIIGVASGFHSGFAATSSSPAATDKVAIGAMVVMVVAGVIGIVGVWMGVLFYVTGTRIMTIDIEAQSRRQSG